ncbi:hypothetical protein OROGR_021357 [Orobanche gracilis]
MIPSVIQQKRGVSGSISGCQSVVVFEIPSFIEKKWRFNVKMRIAKGCILSQSHLVIKFIPAILRIEKQCSLRGPATVKVISIKHLCVWSSPEGGQKIDIGKQIFCNRSLNMRNIVAVGFDMDYTLAQYRPETFESLAYEGTVKKLVNDLGYPTELLELFFDWTYMVRGLVLDKLRGNILKMDRHKYVKVAYHGFRELSKEEKVAAYGSRLIRDAFDEPEYAVIDTLFSLAEAYLFAQLVEYKDKKPGKISVE